MNDIGVLNVGYGNLGTLLRVFSTLNLRVKLVRETHEVLDCRLLVLPGVGSFRTAKDGIESQGLDDTILLRHHESRPILGICLGFQLLSAYTEENGGVKGLGIFNDHFLKLPVANIGWNPVSFGEKFSEFDKNYFYFNHNYASMGVNASVQVPTVSEIVSYRQEGSTIGVQFHPEKSQEVGRQFLTKLLSQL